ncbi:MAG: hypothetical protein WCQ03_06630, partial [Phycisphaerae bacterium]
QTQYTTSSKIWTFNSTFDGVTTDQPAWTFAHGISDCNNNGILDNRDIANGIADDDTDGHLDICEFAKGDLDLNGVLDSGDISIILLYMGEYDPLFGDLDGNGIIGTGDLSLILLNFGEVTWP